MKRLSMKNRRQGAILILVLGMLMLMSIIVSLFLSDVMRDSFLKIQLSGKETLRHEAYNILSAVKCQLEQKLSREGILEKNYDLLKEIKVDLPESMNVTVVVQDESGKIPLNDPNQKMLKALFCLFVDIWDAQKLTQDYWQWYHQKPIHSRMIECEGYRTKTNLSKNKEVKTVKSDEKKTAENLNQGPQFTYALGSYDQLKDISSFKAVFFDEKGVGNSKLDRLIACTTLLGGYPVNINSASKDVLEVMGKNFALDLDRVEQHLGLSENSKEKPKIYKDLKEINSQGHGALTLEKKDSDAAKNQLDVRMFLGTSPRIVSVKIMLREADASFCLSSIFTLTITFNKNKMNKSLVVLEQKMITENNFLPQ